MKKGFKCFCGKSYKTSNGLKNHTTQSHSNGTSETLNGNASSLSTLLTAATSPSTSSSTSLSSLSQYRSPSPASISGNGGVGINNSIINNQSQLSPNPNLNRTSISSALSPSIVTEAAANVAASALVTNQNVIGHQKTTAATVNANFFAIKTTTKNLLNLGTTNATISLAVSSIQNGNKLVNAMNHNNNNLNKSLIDDERNVGNLGNFGILTNTQLISKNGTFNVNDNNNNDFDNFECSNNSNSNGTTTTTTSSTNVTNGNSNSSSTNGNSNKNTIIIGEDT